MVSSVVVTVIPKKSTAQTDQKIYARKAIKLLGVNIMRTHFGLDVSISEKELNIEMRICNMYGGETRWLIVVASGNTDGPPVGSMNSQSNGFDLEHFTLGMASCAGPFL